MIAQKEFSRRRPCKGSCHVSTGRSATGIPVVSV
jgi:hypothetical protein